MQTYQTNQPVRAVVSVAGLAAINSTVEEYTFPGKAEHLEFKSKMARIRAARASLAQEEKELRKSRTEAGGSRAALRLADIIEKMDPETRREALEEFDCIMAWHKYY
jgi:hypothetical protein